MAVDRVKLRIFQQQWYDAVVNAVRREQKVVVGNIHAGSGKTLANLHAANELWRMGEIDAIQVFVPRINLCKQFEKDWREISGLYADPKMSGIDWRSDVPLIRGGAVGYVTTYAALMAAERDKGGNRHERLAASHRTLTILDEAQQLGVAGPGEDPAQATQSARVVLRVVAGSRYVFVVSGTCDRADGMRVILSPYTDPDEHGRIYIKADVEATYKQGVAQGYLRPFEFQLCDGKGIHQYFDGEIEDLQLSRMKSGFYRVLENPDFWQPMVDIWVSHVRAHQQIHPALCGLVGAISQAEADQVLRYVEKRHRGFKMLQATSDLKDANDNLDLFKLGGYDGLVTVGMCHVGYDHKPISVVLCLNDVREASWLDQFFARALRECGLGVTMLAITPDDLLMTRYLTKKRQESREGLLEKEKDGDGEGKDPRQPRLGWTSGVEIGDRRAVGLEEDTELNPGQLQTVERWQVDYNLKTAAATALARLLRARGVSLGGPIEPPVPSPAPRSTKTQREKEADLRAEIAGIVKRCDKVMETKVDPVWKPGHTSAEMNRQFGGKLIAECSEVELIRRLGWLQEEFWPQVRSRAGEQP